MSARSASRPRAALRLVHPSPPARVIDAALLRRASEGEPHAQRALYDAHVQSVMALSLAILRNRADAEDVLQETFVVAFRKLGDLRDASRFRSWLTAITVRRARRRRRREQLLRLLGLGHDDELALEELAAPATPEEALSELRAVDAVLATVPDAQRIAWLLRHVEGESLEDVADACDCSLATVKRWIHRIDIQLGESQADRTTRSSRRLRP